MNFVEEILDTGKLKDSDKLHKAIDRCDVNKLCSSVSACMTDRRIFELLKYIFAGLAATQSKSKRYKVIEKILTDLQNKTCPREGDIVMTFSCELEKLDSLHLVKLISMCIDWAQNGSHEHTSWKDVLPKLLNLASNKNVVEINGNDISGTEYKNKVIKDLCSVKWRPEVVIHLANMFQDVFLNTEEHQSVITLLCECLHRISPQEVPPLAYHLLELCSTQHCIPVFMNLDQYYCSRLYSKAVVAQRVSDQSSYDELDAGEYTENELRESESNVLVHVHDSALSERSGVKDFVKFLKSLTAAYDIVLSPFLFTMLLDVSTVAALEDEVRELLKQAIVKCYLEEEKKNSSVWLQGALPQKSNIDLVVSAVLGHKVCGSINMFQGILNLGFILLSIKSIGKKEQSPAKLWSLGSHIVITLVKEYRMLGKRALQLLLDHILTEGVKPQYTDCLHRLAVRVPTVMRDHQAELMKFLHNLLFLESSVAENVLHAMMPLTTVFHTLTDIMIILLRKALYSRDPAVKQMGIRGFLLILRRQGLKGVSMLTQSASVQERTFSSSSSSTQVASSLSSSEESTCYEVQGILKTCFSQHGDVKMCLYQGLCDASIYKHPKLYSSIRDVLWSQLEKYFVDSEDGMPPLKFGDTTIIQGLHVAVREPLAHLLYVNQRVITKNLIHCSEETIDMSAKALELLADRMARLTLEDMDMVSPDFLTDDLPDSLTKQEKLKQVLGIYEALLSYMVDSCTRETADRGKKIINLFNGYKRFSDFTKTVGKTQKKAGEDKVSLKRKRDGPGEAASKSPTFKLPPTLLDFFSVNRLMDLLLNTHVSWCSADSVSQVQRKGEFRRYVMQAAFSLIHGMHSLRPSEFKNSKTLTEFTECGRIVFKCCINKMEEMIEFDGVSAATSFECFEEILKVVFCPAYPAPSKFFTDIGVECEHDLGKQVVTLMNKYKELLELNVSREEEENTKENDPAIKKITQIIVASLHLLVNHIPTDNTQQIEEEYTWLKTYAENHNISNQNAAKAFVSLLFDVHYRCKPSGPLLQNIAQQLADNIKALDDSILISGRPKYGIVSENIEVPVYILLCNCASRFLEEILWVTAWLKAEYTAQVKSGVTNTDNTDRRSNLVKAEQSLCLHLSHCIKLHSLLCNVAVPVGLATDTTLRSVIHLYGVLATVTQYFILRSTKVNPAFQTAKFLNVLKLSYKSLAQNVSNFVMHIGQQDTEDAPQKKKKKTVDPLSHKNKVLRETKVLPKVSLAKERFEKLVINLSVKTKTNFVNSSDFHSVKSLGFRVIGHVIVNKNAPPHIGTQDQRST